MHGNIVHRDEDSSSDTECASSVHLARKKRKPLMEKKRRARINASLEQLKKLVLDAMKKDSARYSKLEKADILELTVRHLREGQQQQINAAMVNDSSIASKYKAGFVECASEVSRYLSSVDGLGHEVTLRLMQHLTKCIQRVDGPTATSQQQPQQPTVYQQQQQHHHFTVQPLQIQIPSATSSSSLPGSPQPANLPPTPPSSADHSFNSSSSSVTTFPFSESSSPVQHHQHQQQQHFSQQLNSKISNSMTSQAYIRQQYNRHEVLPLKSRENLNIVPASPSTMHSSQMLDLQEQKRSTQRYSPYTIPNTYSDNTYLRMKKLSNALEREQIVVKEENMWRPW